MAYSNLTKLQDVFSITQTDFMFGCVTNGYEWIFLRLENNELLIDTERLFLNQLDELLGTFQMIIDSYNTEKKLIKH